MTHEEFKARYLPLGEGLYRIAFNYLEDSADASDTVQDLFIKLWNSRDRLDAVVNPQAYAYTLLKNLCIDRLRKDGRKVSLDTVPERSSEDPPDKVLADRETLRKVLRHIDALPPKQRQIVRMRIFEELEYEQIAERLGMSEINTRVQLSLARKTLKKRMKSES